MGSEVNDASDGSTAGADKSRVPSLALARSFSELPQPASSLWAVSTSRGLLPSRPPLPAAALPPPWHGLLPLVVQLPAACVAPATFRSLVAAAHETFPRAEGAVALLPSAEEKERARALLAFVVSGWEACSGAAPPPEWLLALFAEVSAALRRSPRLGLTDWILYNWEPLAGPQRSTLPSPPQGSHGAGGFGRDGGTSGAAGQHSKGVAGALEQAEEELPWRLRGERVQPSLRFLCLEEEDWFLRLHVTLAGETGGMVGAINRCLQARTAGEQVRALQLLEHALEVLISVHVAAGIGVKPWRHEAAAPPPRRPSSQPASPHPHQLPPVPSPPSQPSQLPALPLPPHTPLRSAPPSSPKPPPWGLQPTAREQPPPPPVQPRLLMLRMHRFLPHVAGLPLERRTQQAVRVYCATGLDQPCLLQLFGCWRGSHAMQRFREWQMAGDAGGASELPVEHVQFWAACRARTSVREQVEAAVGVNNLSVQDVGRLELAHNSCVDALRRLLTKRMELVESMFGADLLKADWEQELSHLVDARLPLLVERREMVGAVEGQPTRASFYKRHPEERGR